MTCYFRHLKNVFEKAKITVTTKNKQELDQIIHSIVGVKYKNCSAAWREVKKRIAADPAAFVNELRKAVYHHS